MGSLLDNDEVLSPREPLEHGTAAQLGEEEKQDTADDRDSRKSCWRKDAESLRCVNPAPAPSSEECGSSTLPT